MEFPKTLLEFESRFPNERACWAALRRMRWPQGFVCPRCLGTKNSFISTRRLEQCSRCRYQCSITAGTIFHRTHKPLRLWFGALWYVTGQKTGASALGLQRVLGLGSYQTAWTWLHKLRRAMVRPGRDRLAGRVEVDEVFVGGSEPGFEGRSAPRKRLVAIAAEEDGRGTGRIRMARIPNAKKVTLHAFIEENIEPGSLVHTDGWTSYRGLESKGYRHERTALQGAAADLATVSMPRVHRVSSLLKRWLIGTHQGAVSGRHLDYYLDEFTFRFNRRKSRSRGKLFYRLVQQAAQVDPAPYKTIVGGKVDHNI